MPAYYLESAVVLLGLALLMAEAFWEKASPRVLAWIGIAGLAAVFAGLFFVEAGPAADVTATSFWLFYTADSLALFYKGIALLTTIFVLIIALDHTPVLEEYVTRTSIQGGLGEYFSIPVFVCAGLMWMASANDLITVFVSLELVTISFYILVSYMRRSVGSLEAGVKYLILGALSTGFLVYGITWTFGVTGETNLQRIAFALAASEEARVPALFGFALMMAGLGFKIAAVPFQIWVPDVYQGAPTPTTAFLSVGSKAGGFIVLSRVLAPFLNAPPLRDSVILVLLLIAGATLIYGNLAAIPQTNFKRLLAYSSIAHAGFLVLALACVNPDRFDMSPVTVVSFYLATYLLMTLLCFLVLSIVRRQTGSDEINAFNGLHQRSPFLAFALLIGVISLAGVPLTAGFIGKFLVFQLAVDQGQWILLAIAVIGAAAGFYYYLKVVRSIYWLAPDDDDAPAITFSPATRAALAALTAAIIIFGVYPAPILALLP